MPLPPEVQALLQEWTGGQPSTQPGGPPGGGLPLPSVGGPSTAPGVSPVPPRDPVATTWQAQQNLFEAQQQQIDLTRGLAQLTSAANTTGAAAQERVVRGQRNVAQREYLAEQTRANEARRSDELAIQAAQQNTGNILAVARGQRERDTYSYRYNIAGLPTPIDVKLPPDFKGPIPPGIVARLQTLAEILTDAAADKDKMRQFVLEAARIKAAELGVEVDEANIRSGKESLDLEQAELAVRLAGLDVAQQQMRLQAADQPPAPGLVWDDVGQEWVTKQDLEGRGRAREPFSPDALLELRVRGVIDDDGLRAELRKFGYLPDTIETMVKLAHARAESTDDDLAAALAQFAALGAPAAQPSSGYSSPLSPEQIQLIQQGQLPYP